MKENGVLWNQKILAKSNKVIKALKRRRKIKLKSNLNKKVKEKFW